MKAAFYIGNATMETGPQPGVEPAPGMAQIKVAYCGICGTDLHIFHGKMDRRVHIPQIIGHEMSGTISALGSGVKGFAVGDRVTVMPLDPCNNCPACRAGHIAHLPEPEVSRNRHSGGHADVLDDSRSHAAPSSRDTCQCATPR